MCVVCDVGMEMDVLPKLHDRLWLLVATTHTPPPQVNEAFAAQYLAVDSTELAEVTKNCLHFKHMHCESI